MKRIILGIATIAALPVHAGVLIAGWDFNTGTNTQNAYLASNGTQGGSASLLVGGTFGSSDLIEPSGPPTFNTGERTIGGTGYTVGLAFNHIDTADGFTAFSTEPNANFSLFGNKNTTSLNGKSVVFAFNTLGFTDIVFEMAAERASGGPNLNNWAWSTNGTDYVAIGSAWDPATAVSAFVIDLTAVNAFENQSNAYLRLTMNGQAGTTASTNYLNFDNVQIGGTPVVPEPSTWAAIAGLGVLGAALIRRRRLAR